VTDTYTGQHSETVAAPKGKRKFTRKQIVIASVLGAVIIAPPAAYAAVKIFGFGSFEQAAGTPTALQITGTPTTTKTLAPGQTVGVKGIVKNTNDFPVKITSIVIKKDSETVVPAADAAACKISLVAPASTTTFPEGNGSTPAASPVYNLSTAVTIQPGFSTEIVVPNVVTQDATATKLCGIKADYAVIGEVGSN